MDIVKLVLHHILLNALLLSVAAFFGAADAFAGCQTVSSYVPSKSLAEKKRLENIARLHAQGKDAIPALLDGIDDREDASVLMGSPA